MLTFIYIVFEVGGGGKNPLQLATKEIRQGLAPWEAKAREMRMQSTHFPSTPRPATSGLRLSSPSIWGATSPCSHQTAAGSQSSHFVCAS